MLLQKTKRSEDTREAKKLSKPFKIEGGLSPGECIGTMQTIIAPKGHLFLMDVYGQGRLDFISLKTDGSVRLDIIDGPAGLAPT